MIPQMDVETPFLLAVLIRTLINKGVLTEEEGEQMVEDRDRIIVERFGEKGLE